MDNAGYNFTNLIFAEFLTLSTAFEWWNEVQESGDSSLCQEIRPCVTVKHDQHRACLTLLIDVPTYHPERFFRRRKCCDFNHQFWTRCVRN